MPWNPQHTEALALLFAQVLVVDFMSFADGHQVGVFCAGKNLESLMDKDIVYQEISEPIRGNARPNPYPKITACHGSRDKTPRTGYCENQEKGIVFFKESRLMDVVIFVKIPHQPVHQVLVGKPRDAFHRYKRSNDNECRKEGCQRVHGNQFRKRKKHTKMATSNPVPMFFPAFLGIR